MKSTIQIDAEQAAKEDQLVREHLPLVQYVVSEVAHRVPNHVSRSDLVSAGMLGLAQAARSFDPERGIAFDRFASTRIRGALLDELRGRDWASRSVRSRARGLQATQEELTNRLGRAPKPEEVARSLGISPETVHKLVDDVHRATVLNYDSLVVEGDAESFIASPDDGPEDTLLDRERKAYLMDAVGALPERLRRVVIGYFFEERSMQDLADELGVSESRISQLRAEALLLLRDGVNSQLEPDALPDEPRPNGRVARRKASYYAAVASGSDFRTRLSDRPIEGDDIVDRTARAAVGGAYMRTQANALMRINTLNGRNRASIEASRPGMGESFEEFEAELHSAIAKLHVSDENATASDSHVDHAEMSAAMRIYTERQLQLQPGSATRALAEAAPRTILDLLQ